MTWRWHFEDFVILALLSAAILWLLAASWTMMLSLDEQPQQSVTAPTTTLAEQSVTAWQALAEEIREIAERDGIGEQGAMTILVATSESLTRIGVNEGELCVEPMGPLLAFHVQFVGRSERTDEGEEHAR